MPAHRVVEFMAERFAPLAAQRIVVLCGKGNNGGDGLVVARQLLHALPSRGAPRGAARRARGAEGRCRGELPDAAGLRRPGRARDSGRGARLATLVVDALLGTGITGPATGRMLDGIREINSGFPLAKVVAVDIPSGHAERFGRAGGRIRARRLHRDVHRAEDRAGDAAELRPRRASWWSAPIGSPPALYDDVWLSLVEPAMFRALLAPRPPGGHKGTFGHVLVVAGSPGKTGAAAMAGMAALRAGAGLVTVASAERALPQIAAHAPELMTARARRIWLEPTGRGARP